MNPEMNTYECLVCRKIEDGYIVPPQWIRVLFQEYDSSGYESCYDFCSKECFLAYVKRIKV